MSRLEGKKNVACKSNLVRAILLCCIIDPCLDRLLPIVPIRLFKKKRKIIAGSQFSIILSLPGKNGFTTAGGNVSTLSQGGNVVCFSIRFFFFFYTRFVRNRRPSENCHPFLEKQLRYSLSFRSLFAWETIENAWIRCVGKSIDKEKNFVMSRSFRIRRNEGKCSRRRKS